MMRHANAAACLVLLNAHAVGSKDPPQEVDIGNDNIICIAPEASSPLALARNLHAPLATDTEDAEFEHASFWDVNGPLLQDAWKEYEKHMQTCTMLSSNDIFLNPNLSTALENAFGNPAEETEAEVKLLWRDNEFSEKSLPKGVYATQVLTESGVFGLRQLLDAATSSGIPTRRPNGMNRHGVIVDSEVEGAVSMESLVKLVEEEIINQVVRPVGRMLFPDRVGCDDDLEYFAFTIRYDGSDNDEDNRNSVNEDGTDDGNMPKRDFELKEHRDASVVTLNINLNLPGEGYDGSEVYFREFPSGDSTSDEQDHFPQDGESDGGTVRFSPGMAIIHLGAHRHGSLPISASASKNGSGKRYNLVIWLFGKDGDVRIAPYEKEEQMDIMTRWRGCNEPHSMIFN